MSVECGSAQLPNFLLAMRAHFLFERDIAAVKFVCCVLDSCGASVLFFAHTRSSSCVYMSDFLCVLVRVPVRVVVTTARRRNLLVQTVV